MITQGKLMKIRLTLTLLGGLIIISTLGCATKKPCLNQIPLPPKPQIQIQQKSNDEFSLTRADLVKLEEYISALERAAK